jgi:glycosyltransferase involved in cell wall biosynthesis
MTTASVIMPVYNVEKYLEPAIRSVLAQTFTDFELIIVDDGATDGSAAIYSSFGDPRIRIIKQKNRGLAGARNTGIRDARGAYIGLLDSDDLWRPEKLARHIAHLEAQPDLGVSYSASEFIDEQGESLNLFMSPRLTGIDAGYILCRNPIGNGSAPVFRAQVFEDIAFTQNTPEGAERWYFDETFRYGEDIECWMRIAALTRWRFEGLADALTLYRVVSGTLSANTEKMFEYWSRMLARVQDYAPALVAAHGDKARAYQLRYYARRAVQEGQKGKALTYLRRALALHPRMVVEEPRRTVVTIGAVALSTVMPRQMFGRLQRRVARIAPGLASSR